MADATHSLKIKTLTAPILRRAALDSFIKLTPMAQWKNPVMFVAWVGSVLTTLLFIQAVFVGGSEKESALFILAVTLWLWFTILFANFAESVAEGRGKAQAAAMRSTKQDIVAKKLAMPLHNITPEMMPASDLHKGDIVLVEVGDFIPADGVVIEGAATVNSDPGDPFVPPEQEAVLGEIQRHRLGRRQSGQKPDENAADAAVGDDDRVSCNRAQPSGGAPKPAAASMKAPKLKAISRA